MDEQEYLTSNDGIALLSFVSGHYDVDDFICPNSIRKTGLILAAYLAHKRPDYTRQADALTSALDSAMDGEITPWFDLMTPECFDVTDKLLRPAVPKQILVSIVRDVFGNPFRGLTIQHAHITPTVKQFARMAFDEKDFSILPLIADILFIQGCQTEVLLQHLRAETQHYRGCWAIDLLLGREAYIPEVVYEIEEV